MKSNDNKTKTIPLAWQSGFTLLEVLIAMGLSAFVGILAFQGITVAINSYEQLTAHSQRISRLQTTWHIIGRDLQQAIHREITDENEDDIESFISDTNNSAHLIEFTHTGWANPIDVKRSTLQRVRYLFEDNTLWRLHWTHLDRTDSKHDKIVLLDNIDAIKVSFLLPNTNDLYIYQWTNEWPPPTPFNSYADKLKPIKNPEESFNNNEEQHPSQPLAVKISITLSDLGEIERIFILPESME